jgi:hypothetical protein
MLIRKIVAIGLSLLILAGCASPLASGATPQPSGFNIFFPLIDRSNTVPPANPTPIVTAPSPTAIIPPPSSLIYFPIGPGGADVIPHQIVRTQNDHIFIVAYLPYVKKIFVYWSKLPGFPQSASDFTSISINTSGEPISVDTAYDGQRYIHIISNLNNGQLWDYVFDVNNSVVVGSKALMQDSATVTGDYGGSSGISAMFDQNLVLHLVYWKQGNQINYVSFNEDSQSGNLVKLAGPTRLDSDGKSNHPVLAVSPIDNSVVAAWVSEAADPVKIIVREKNTQGTWSSPAIVTKAPVWHSTSFGINIDQGPSLIIDGEGNKHLTYIENYDSTGDYGHVHYVMGDGSGWLDTPLNFYSHDPALAWDTNGGLYIIGHGHPLNSACKSMDDMCYSKKTANQTWETPQLFASPPSGKSFDSSPSVKWSVVGFNRGETVEFLFFMTPYANPTVYYGRLP